MSARVVAIAAVAVAALVALTAWAFGMPLGEAALTAPIIVACAGAIVGFAVLWARVAWDSLRRQRHPARIVAAGVAAVALLLVISFWIDLPKRY